MKDLEQIPEITDLSMSNIDHSIDRGLAKKLKEGYRSHHAAWNFYGRVWYEKGQFHEQVWCYGSPREEFSAKTLSELMNKVNAAYGND